MNTYILFAQSKDVTFVRDITDAVAFLAQQDNVKLLSVDNVTPDSYARTAAKREVLSEAGRTFKHKVIRVDSTRLVDVTNETPIEDSGVRTIYFWQDEEEE